MSNCISLIGIGPTEQHLKGWALASDMTDVIETKTLENVCLVGNEIKADEFVCPDVICADVCALVLHECNEDTDKIILIQTPPCGVYDSDEGLVVCMEGFCLQSDQPECCGDDEILDLCEQMEDPCVRHKWLKGIYYSLLSNKTVVSATTPSGRSVTFARASAQCLKDEMQKAEIECNQCNPCRRESRCWTYRNC